MVGHDSLPVGWLSDIEMVIGGADARGQRLALGIAYIRDDDGRPFGSEGFGNGGTDSAGGACDQRRFYS